MSNEGARAGVNASHSTDQGDVNSFFLHKHSQGNLPAAAASSAFPSHCASTSQAVAEAVAETVEKEVVPPTSRSAGVPSSKPSTRSILEVLLQLQSGLKAGATAGTMAKKQQKQDVKAAQGDGAAIEGPSPPNAHAATKGGAPSPCRLFEASGPPSHPLFRKEGQSIAGALGRRSLRQSCSLSHHSSHVSSSGGGGSGGGGGGGGVVGHNLEGYGSCPSSPGPESEEHSKAGGEGSTRQSGPLSGRGSSSGRGGAADVPNCSALSLEPWLAAGVVEEGGRPFSRARGSGKRRSSGVGLGSPLGGSHTPGHSSKGKQRSGSWHRSAGSGTQEREGLETGGEDAQASTYAGRGPGGEVEELQRQSRGPSARSSSDFFAILKKSGLSQTTQRTAPSRRSMERLQTPSPSPSTSSATGNPHHRKTSSLILQQHHQQHSHLRSPDLSSAGPGSTQSLRTPFARPSVELRSHHSDSGACTASSREGSVRSPSRDDTGVGSSSSPFFAAQGRKVEKPWSGGGGATRSPTTAPGVSHPSPFSNYPPSTSGGPALTTIFSGALWRAARGAREAAGEGGGEPLGGRAHVLASTALESSPSSSNPLPSTPHETPTATMGDHKGLGPSPLFSDDSVGTEPLVPPGNEAKRRPPSAPESMGQGHGPPSLQQQQQQLSTPVSNASSSRACTSGSRSPPIGSQTAQQRRRQKAAAILMARRASESPCATSNGHTHRPTHSAHSTHSTPRPASHRLAPAGLGHEDNDTGSAHPASNRLAPAGLGHEDNDTGSAHPASNRLAPANLGHEDNDTGSAHPASNRLAPADLGHENNDTGSAHPASNRLALADLGREDNGTDSADPASHRLAPADLGHENNDMGDAGPDYDNDDSSNAEQESAGTEGDARRFDGGRSAMEAARVRDSRKSVNLSLPSLSHVYSCVDMLDSMEAQSKADTSNDHSGDDCDGDEHDGDDQSQEGQDSTPAVNPLYGLPQIHRSASIKYNTLRRIDSGPQGRSAIVPWNPNSQPGIGALARKKSNLSSVPGGLYTVGSWSGGEVGSNASDQFAGAAASTGTAMRTARSKSPDGRASRHPTSTVGGKVGDLRPLGRPPHAPNGYAARLAHRNALQQLEDARKKTKGPKHYAAATVASVGKKAPASQPSVRGFRPVLMAPSCHHTSVAPSSRRSSSSLGGATFLDHGGSSACGMSPLGSWPEHKLMLHPMHPGAAAGVGSWEHPTLTQQHSLGMDFRTPWHHGSVTEGEREEREERVGGVQHVRALFGSHDLGAVPAQGSKGPTIGGPGNANQGLAAGSGVGGSRPTPLEQLYLGPGLEERPLASRLRHRVSFSEGLSQPEKATLPRSLHPLGSRKLSALVQDILQEENLSRAASSITPEVLAQLGLTPQETRTTHQATTNALAALRSGSFDKRTAAEHRLEGSSEQGGPPLAASTGQLPAFLRAVSTRRTQRPLQRSHDSLQGWLGAFSRSGFDADMFRSISLPPRPKTASQAPSCTTPPKGGRDSGAKDNPFATPPRLVHSSTQPRSACYHGGLQGILDNHQLQRSCSGQSSIGSHSLPPLAPALHPKGPDAPGSYSRRLRAAKAMQSSGQHHTTSPRGSTKWPAHQRVLPAGEEDHDSDLDAPGAGGVQPASPGRSTQKADGSWAGVGVPLGEEGSNPRASVRSPSSKRNSMDCSTPRQDGPGATSEGNPPLHEAGSPMANSTGKNNDKTVSPARAAVPSPGSPEEAASAGAGGGAVQEEEMLSVPEREEEGVEGGMGKESESEEGCKEEPAEDATLKIASTPEGRELLQQVTQDDYTVEAAMASLKNGVHGRVKGGLLQQLEEAQRAKQEKEVDKADAAGFCSCFGPPKPAKKPQGEKVQQQQQQQPQRLEFVADEEKVTFVERGGPGVAEKLHTIRAFKFDMPWSKDAVVTLDCVAQEAAMRGHNDSYQVCFTTASGADFAHVVLGLQATLQHRRKDSGGVAVGLDCLVGDLPWITS